MYIIYYILYIYIIYIYIYIYVYIHIIDIHVPLRLPQKGQEVVISIRVPHKVYSSKISNKCVSSVEKRRN